MVVSFQPSTRILAIDPGTRYFGVAVLDGADLIYYGVKDLTDKRPADTLLRATREVILDLVRDHRPSVLAHEKSFYAQSKNSALLQVQEAEIKRVGAAAGLPVVGYSPARVRKLLCRDGRATKQRVADALVRRFPELMRYRRSEERPEWYWLNMFDALAVAVVCADGAGAVNRIREDGTRVARVVKRAS